MTSSTMPDLRVVQRQRSKGWRKPPNTVYVGRGSKWGNPFTVADGFTVKEATHLYIKYAIKNIGIDTIEEELTGKNLMCWCGDWRFECEPHYSGEHWIDVRSWSEGFLYCHAKVLMILANCWGYDDSHKCERMTTIYLEKEDGTLMSLEEYLEREERRAKGYFNCNYCGRDLDESLYPLMPVYCDPCMSREFS